MSECLLQERKSAITAHGFFWMLIVQLVLAASNIKAAASLLVAPVAPAVTNQR